MKLLVQSDDYGLTDSITCGILKGIREGVITCTGLMSNLPSSKYAAKQIQNYPDTCFGQDINIVAGKPVTDPKFVPHLVDENGYFIKSVVRTADPSWSETDPYPYEETILEVENQVKRFIELVGRRPEYIQGHSIQTPNIRRAIDEVGQKYKLSQPGNIIEAFKVYRLIGGWNKKPFPIMDQINASTIDYVMNHIDEFLGHKITMIHCHAGFVDEDTFRRSSYTIIRQKDLEMVISARIKKWIKENDVELISYRDLQIV